MNEEKLLGADAAAVVAAGSIASDAATARRYVFTAGPWKARPVVHNHKGVAVSGADVLSKHGRFVADCGSHEDATFNARLIATAPELLAHLRDAFEELQLQGVSPECEEMQAIAATIAKAEGR